MTDDILVGVHYFAGWWEPLPNKWVVGDNDWRKDYPNRVPLLGEFNTQETMDREIDAAASHGVDFFQILWYYNDPNSQRESHSRLLNRGVKYFLSSPNSNRMKFLVEFCNHPPFQVETDEQWADCIQEWIKAMHHPSYLRIDRKVVFKVHGGHYFLKQNGNDLDTCKRRLDVFRNAVREAGLGEMLIGCGVAAHESVSKDSRYAQLFDFTNTYMDVPNCELADEPYPYDVLAENANSGRHKHRNDAIPYEPFLPAGWYPRPWKDPRPDFQFPSDREWRRELKRMKQDLESCERFGFPKEDGTCQKAFTIYAWNEFGEGGIVAPTAGDEYMKLQAIHDVFPNERPNGELTMEQARTYGERYRPQFHFTSRTNWLNDPNGCVYFDGQYHLFYQHNPKDVQWGNMTWGHAVSTDLVHWHQLPNAIFPYDGGTIYSGTAVVDSKDSAGFGENALVAAFTHARKPFGQALAYSTDHGWSWNLYDDGKRIVDNQGLDEGERDPKVFWHEPSDKWVMVLWVKHGMVRIFLSDDLRNWTHASDFRADGFFECPDLFELPVNGDEDNKKWVIYDAAFNYWIGDFDGRAFTVEEGPFPGDLGKSFYAAQTWNNTKDRIVQIGWMRGGQYPGMPFNQQMSFPCELTLRTTPGGVRLFRMPVPEIDSLHDGSVELEDRTLTPGNNLIEAIQAECADIRLRASLGPDSILKFHAYGQTVSCSTSEIKGVHRSANRSASEVDLRILLDRTSIEVFADQGALSMSDCFVPQEIPAQLGLFAEGGQVLIKELTIHHLKSAWE